MKTTLSILLILLILSAAGCSSTSIERVEADGTKFSARNSRFFWKSTGVDIRYDRTGTNITAGARLDQSGTDAEALRAVAEGVATGLGKAAKP